MMICEYHDASTGRRARKTIGMTGNGEYLCERCLREEYRYAAQHVPEALKGCSEDDYVRECTERLMSKKG